MGRGISIRSLLLAIAALLFSPLAAHAVPVGFYNITGSIPGDAAIGEAQLWVDVLPYAPGKVSFTFYNRGPAPCSITRIYFDDGALLGLASILNGPGVSFSQGANPPELPGAQNVVPPFVVTAGFLVQSVPPLQPNGVNPGEHVTIVFNLIAGRTFPHVLEDLISGALRIGIHVQGFASGGSESFVNKKQLCKDMDQDGFGNPASDRCDYPDLDCDDSNAQINPLAAEVCNGKDDDCDGIIDNVDADGDGYVDAACGGNDCDDTNFSVNPQGFEVCTNGIDDDCDGMVDDADSECASAPGWELGGTTAEASALDGGHAEHAKAYNSILALLIIPVAVILGLGILRSRP